MQTTSAAAVRSDGLQEGAASGRAGRTASEAGWPAGARRSDDGNTLFRAYRYGPDFPGLAGKDAEAGQDD